VPAEATRDMDEGSWRAGDVHERRKIIAGLNGHSHERCFAHRPSQPAEKIPQPTRIVRSRNDRAAADAGARCIAISVCYFGATFELKCGILFVEGHHARRCLEKGIYTSIIEVVSENFA
jgi:hypothetical protein